MREVFSKEWVASQNNKQAIVQRFEMASGAYGGNSENIDSIFRLIFISTQKKEEYNIQEVYIEIQENARYGQDRLRISFWVQFYGISAKEYFISFNKTYLYAKLGLEDISNVIFVLKYAEKVGGFDIKEHLKKIEKYLVVEVIKEKEVERIVYSSNPQYRCRERKKQFSYIMKDESNGLFKLGKSINPRVRESTLQSEKPSIKLVHKFEVDIEAELHKKYKENRVRGEWFNIKESEINKIISTYK